MFALRDFAQHLINTVPLIERDLIEAEQVDESRIIPSGRATDQFSGEMLLYREEYEGAVLIESWTHPKEIILAAVAAWFLNHPACYDHDEYGFPTVDATRNDDNSWDIIILATFVEELYIRPDPEGDICIGGNDYQRVLNETHTAEDFQLFGTIEKC